MYRKILYPTDFSETAELALEHIKTMRKLGGEKVILLNVIDKSEEENLLSTIFKIFNIGSKEREEIEKKLKDESLKKLDEIKKELESLGFEVKNISVFGTPHEEIVKVANEEDVDIIIMGSHGKTNIKEILLGSVTEHVIKKSDKPVMVIRRAEG
ncbi:UspA domain protein [Methanocaldococcus infernus ME]|uniref:UspA domain protein n=1 Tax=Methanocaldococcus infernus (strain DSM 11812 / JCM 15783 / ME) TaxID=573063 RepID=D5VTB7_METIM|nr:universal stress protein [Methanocaldococcus infernus]ADG13820.1 UspA domain protein [Methanocaldococcus infernus ME]